LNILPILAVLGSIVSLTVGTSFGKQLFPAIGPGGTAAYRVVFAAIILLAVWRPWRSRLNRKDAIAIALYGGTLGLMNFVFYQAIDRLPLGIAIAIEFTGPLAVAVLSSRRLIDFVWIGLAALGLLFLLPFQVSAQSLNPTGIAFAFASALLWALYIIFGKRLAHLPGGYATSCGMVAAALTILPLALAESGAHLFQPALFLPGIALAVASSAVPYSLEMFALKKLPKNTFGILLSLEPAVGAISGFLVLHETLSWTQWIAIGCIMSASAGTTYGARQETAEATCETVPADVL
jgi:inner membrane transporter RhtA